LGCQHTHQAPQTRPLDDVAPAIPHGADEEPRLAVFETTEASLASLRLPCRTLPELQGGGEALARLVGSEAGDLDRLLASSLCPRSPRGESLGCKSGVGAARDLEEPLAGRHNAVDPEGHVFDLKVLQGGRERVHIS
jgi:hypothetical protein